MACDVFSFGVVIWEVATGGNIPYPDMPVLQAVIAVAQENLRPEIGPGVDPLLARLMPQCWAAEAAERPVFAEIAEALQGAIRSDTGVGGSRGTSEEAQRGGEAQPSVMAGAAAPAALDASERRPATSI